MLVLSFSIRLVLKMSSVLGEGAWENWRKSLMYAVLAMVMLYRDIHKETLSKLHALNMCTYCLGRITPLIKSRCSVLGYTTSAHTPHGELWDSPNVYVKMLNSVKATILSESWNSRRSWMSVVLTALTHSSPRRAPHFPEPVADPEINSQGPITERARNLVMIQNPNWENRHIVVTP